MKFLFLELFFRFLLLLLPLSYSFTSFNTSPSMVRTAITPSS